MEETVEVHLTQEQYAWLAGRAERSNTKSVGLRLQIELDLWRETLNAELARQKWTQGELNIISGCYTRPHSDTVPAVGFVADGIMRGRAGQEDFDDPVWVALVDKALRLGPAADAALTDAMDRWWYGIGPDSFSFERVGITPVDDDMADVQPSPESDLERVPQPYSQYQLTAREAFHAMVDFIWDYYDRWGPDAVGVLSDTSLFRDGTPHDPAMWGDWLDSVDRIRAGKPARGDFHEHNNPKHED